MTRPTTPTIKRLFAVSGNRCAFPGCARPLVTEGTVTGEICHIKARSLNGPRYDPRQTDQERHGFENLILMCPSHHKVIDDDATTYTVEKLLKIKARHEARYAGGREPSDEVARRFITPPQPPYLHWLIGRDVEKRDLVDLYAKVKRTRRGATVFLMGQQCCGRRALAEWMQSQAQAQDDAVATARFWDPRALSPGESTRIYWATPVMEKYGQFLTERFPKTGKTIAGASWLNLAAQLAQVDAGDALTFFDGPDDPRTLNQLVRKVARHQPLLLIVEYLDWADSLWIDLLRILADEIAQDLPVLLLVTLGAQAPLDELSGRQHTEPTRLVEELVKQRLAHSHYLGSVTADEIVASIGPADPELGERLHSLGDGDPYIVQVLWEEWVEQGAVVRDDNNAWRASPTQDGKWRVYGDARDHSRKLLGNLLEGWEQPPPFSPDKVERFLNCAAVEGEVFTATAVANVMGVAPDDLIDFFDDYLVIGSETGNQEDEEAYETTESVLVEEGFAQVDSQRSLCQYRFARPYLHHVYAKYPRDEIQRRTWSGQLAGKLEQLYYPLAYQIAPKLFDLFEAAGLPERAEPYRRRRAVKSSLEGLLWHVQLLIETTPDDDRFGIYRLFDRGFELSGRLAIEQPGLWEDGYEVAEELKRRAELVGDREYQAGACYYMAWHQLNAGHPVEALPLTRQAVELYQESSGPNSTNTARGTSILGSVLYTLGDLTGARAAFERALGIDEAAFGPDHPKVAIRVNNLGTVLKALGDLAGARAAYERALGIDEAAFGPDHPNVARDVNNLGGVLQDLGDLAGARAAFERALGIDEAAFGPDHPNVAIRVNNLGMVLKELGDLAGARAAFERALTIDEAAFGPDHPNVARDVNNLGTVLQDLGDLAGARAAFERALGIDEAAFGPDHPNVARDVNNLGTVLKALGDLAGARAAFERALAINEATFGPDHPKVATDVNNLGSVLRALGDLAGARAAYERALGILENSQLPPDHPYIKSLRRKLESLNR